LYLIGLFVLLTLIFSRGWATDQTDAESDSDAGASNKVNTGLVISAAEPVGRLAERIAEHATKVSAGRLEVSPTTNGAAVANLCSGCSSIAILTRLPTSKEFAALAEKGRQPVCQLIGYTVLSVQVDKANPVHSLTIDQLRNIFAGRIDNWKEVGGKDVPIQAVLSRYDHRNALFAQAVMADVKWGKSVMVPPVNESPQRISEPLGVGAISFTLWGSPCPDAAKEIAVGKVIPSENSVIEGSYPLRQPIWIITDGLPKPGTAASDFSRVHLRKRGLALLRDSFCVPVTGNLVGTTEGSAAKMDK